MNNLLERLEHKDWPGITAKLALKGFVTVPGVLTEEECNELIGAYGADDRYRKTIRMERYRFGMGEYKYFQYPLPPVITTIRSLVYSRIVPVANGWMQSLHLDRQYPATHVGLLSECHAAGQINATVLILKYGEGGFNTLHQDLYGEVYFPLQLVLFLNEPELDYTGGEFVLTEQIPRAQSKATVLRPKRGDMLLFATNFRPVQGARRSYRVSMKHGVSPVHSGIRHTLGIIFHDAVS